jgi:ribosomal protein S18 acetylase RimI-like enzyme
VSASVHLRDASAEDSPGIARVHVRTWQSAYRGLLAEDFLGSLSEASRQGRWREILAQPGSTGFTLVAEQDGQIVGFASAGPERSGDPNHTGEVYAIYVLPGRQHEGIGQRLIQASARRLVEAGLASMLVWVLSENPSRKFYEALGGKFLREQSIEIGSQTLMETAYGWTDITPLAG